MRKLEFDSIGIRPVRYDKDGPAYSKADVNNSCLLMIINDTFFERKAKKMATDAEEAIEVTNKVTKEFSESLDKFLAMEKQFAEQSKRSAGTVRDSAEKLAQGLSRVEKVANFDRLERYVVLLERAASAMNSLAELEANGKLEKIACAIR